MPSGRENTSPGQGRLKAATGAPSSSGALVVISTPGATGAAPCSFRPASGGRPGVQPSRGQLRGPGEAGRRLGEICPDGFPGGGPPPWAPGGPGRRPSRAPPPPPAAAGGPPPTLEGG